MSAFPWQAVAWDIDGTLVDSEPLHLAALIAASDEQGLDLRHLPADHFVGVHMGDVWLALKKDLPPALTEAAFLHRIHHFYAAGTQGLQPVTGAVEVVRSLDAAGIVQVCASNSGRRVVDSNLAAIGIAGLMRGTISLDDVTHGKPAPEPYLRAAALAGVPPGRVLAVEDSMTGTRAAKAAGMTVALLVPPGHPSPAGDIQPDHIITALDQILRLPG